VEGGSSLPQLQEPATCPYPEPDQSNQCLLNSTSWMSVLPSTPRCSKCSLSSEISSNILTASVLSPYVLHIRPFNSSWFYHPNNIRWENHGHFIPYIINVTVNNIISEKCDILHDTLICALQHKVADNVKDLCNTISQYKRVSFGYKN